MRAIIIHCKHCKEKFRFSEEMPEKKSRELGRTMFQHLMKQHPKEANRAVARIAKGIFSQFKMPKHFEKEIMKFGQAMK